MRVSLFILLLFTFFLKSCYFSNCKQVSLSGADKIWFSPYSLGDTIFFISNKLNIDTFLVSDKGNYYSTCSKLELGNFQYETMRLSLESFNCHGIESDRCFSQIEFSMNSSNHDQSEKRFKLFDLKGELSSDTPSEKIMLGVSDVVYDTYLFKKDISAFSSSNHFLNSFNWHPEYGLVRYTTNKGEVFDLK